MTPPDKSTVGPTWDAWCMADDVLRRAHVAGRRSWKLRRRARRLMGRLGPQAQVELQAWEET